MILIIWFVCWRGLTSRDDALDPHALSQKQLGDDLLVCPRGKVIEKIDHRAGLRLAQDSCSEAKNWRPTMRDDRADRQIIAGRPSAAIRPLKAM